MSQNFHDGQEPCRHFAPRYKRQGALQLFAGLSVVDGYKYGQTSEQKRFVDFQSFLLQVIFPEAILRKVHTLILILDNGPTHAPKRLESWLQEYEMLYLGGFPKESTARSRMDCQLNTDN